MKKFKSGLYFDAILDDLIEVTEIGGMYFVDTRAGRLSFKSQEKLLPIMEACEFVGAL